MSKILKIGNEDYVLEFGVKAALNDECLISITNLFLDIGISNDSNENNIKAVLSGLANIPKTALTIFYAGLMQHHGAGEKADKKVLSKEDAETLIVKYISEHKGEEGASFAGIMAMCFEVMEEDGFLPMIGLDKLVEKQKAEINDKPEMKTDQKKKRTRKKSDN